MSAQIRDVLNSVPSYRPGRAVPGTIKLSSNENPFPPLDGVLEAAVEAARTMNRYPDLAAVALTSAIAESLRVDPKHIAVGTGSVGVLQQIVQSVAEPGTEVVFPWRSFEAYPIIVQIAGADGVPVALTDTSEIDLTAIAAAVSERTRLVLLCTPNNPTGPALAHEAVLDFLDRVPRNVLVVIDEAYVEFVQAADAVDGLAVLHRHPNVCLLRTFSKAYGLAGLRVGFAVAQPALAEAIRKCAVPFGVSSIAQAAAIESLRRSAEMHDRVTQVVVERERVRQSLLAQGWNVPCTEANFVWLPLAQQAEAFAEQCGQAGVIVRPFTGEGCRVTIGSPEENDRLLVVASTWAQRAAADPQPAGLRPHQAFRRV